MTNLAAPPAVHIRCPADLVEVIPFLLGFHPEDSLVVVELHGRAAGTVVRVDLAELEESGGFVTEMAARFAENGADGAIAVVYSHVGSAAQLPAAELLGRLAITLQAVRISLHDALYVVGGRWWSYSCLDPRCCPPEGSPLPRHGRRTSAIAAIAAAAGLVALPDRAALERSLDPATEAPDAAMQAALRHAEAALVRAVGGGGGRTVWRAVVRRRLRQLLCEATAAAGERGQRWLTDHEVACLVVGLADPIVRDACWRELDRHRSAEAFTLWHQIALRAWPPYDTAPMFLLGWLAWRRGDGALARIAAHRVLAGHAGYEAARLLLKALDYGVDPHVLPTVSGGQPRPARVGRR